jgi:mRNA interferase RelE/StbE
MCAQPRRVRLSRTAAPRSPQQAPPWVTARHLFNRLAATALALTEVLTRLGRLAQDLSAEPEPAPVDALPDWLAQRLIRQVRLPRDRVERMSLHEAVDAWTEWSNRPPTGQ